MSAIYIARLLITRVLWRSFHGHVFSSERKRRALRTLCDYSAGSAKACMTGAMRASAHTTMHPTAALHLPLTAYTARQRER
eukprot:4443068-Pleurochrysis_carterae.AAC.1